MRISNNCLKNAVWKFSRVTTYLYCTWMIHHHQHVLYSTVRKKQGKRVLHILSSVRKCTWVDTRFQAMHDMLMCRWNRVSSHEICCRLFVVGPQTSGFSLYIPDRGYRREGEEEGEEEGWGGGVMKLEKASCHTHIYNFPFANFNFFLSYQKTYPPSPRAYRKQQ